MFPRNFWYVAASDWEVRRQELMPRTVRNEPIVFYRQKGGTPAAPPAS
jgi:phenylpropionate dioxygenase-like ring-hydroxylating dioxygenase large terminal subunit